VAPSGGSPSSAPIIGHSLTLSFMGRSQSLNENVGRDEPLKERAILTRPVVVRPLVKLARPMAGAITLERGMYPLPGVARPAFVRAIER
jgi:hypothetical protein